MKEGGWGGVLGEGERGGDEEGGRVGGVEEGEYLGVWGVDVVEKERKGKGVERERRVLGGMEKGGREVEDGEVKGRVKDVGIGRGGRGGGIMERVLGGE